MRTLLVILLAFALAGAGCLAAPGATTGDAVAPAAAEGPLDLTLLPSADGEAPSLAAPAKWETGQWWRIRVTDMFSGETTEVTKVVVGARGDQYVVGMPADAWRDDLLILHIPGYTPVNRSDMSFQVHNGVFHPLKFPLVDGDSWQTAFHGPDVGGGYLTAVATVLSPTVAEVELAGEGGHIELTYDAEVGHITRFVHSNYGSFEVVDHGTGYEGDVRVALDQRVVFLSARAASVVGVNPIGPAAPVDSATVEEGWSHLSLSLLAGGVVGGPAQPGVFGVRAVAPDGTTYEGLVTPADGPRYHSWPFEHADPAGEWQFQHLGAGAGVTLVEGIAHNAYTVTLPQGVSVVG